MGKDAFDGLESSVAKLEKRLRKALDGAGDPKEVEAECKLERARLNLVLAKAINALFCARLQAVEGVSKEDHPVLSDLRRIDRALGRVTEALAERNAKEEEAIPSARQKRGKASKRKRKASG